MQPAPLPPTTLRMVFSCSYLQFVTNMLQLITLPIIATCNIIVNQFLYVFSKIHIFFAFLLCFQQVFFFFFCKLILFNGSHKIVTFCNISKYLIHDIEFLNLEIQYIENGAGYPAPFPAIIPATLEAPSSSALLSCFTTIYSHKISDCICDTTAYMISHFKKEQSILLILHQILRHTCQEE